MSETQLLAYLPDHAFETGEFHSLLGNLRSVDASLWQAQLPGSVRCIADEDRWRWQIDAGIAP